MKLNYWIVDKDLVAFNKFITKKKSIPLLKYRTFLFIVAIFLYVGNRRDFDLEAFTRNDYIILTVTTIFLVVMRSIGSMAQDWLVSVSIQQREDFKKLVGKQELLLENDSLSVIGDNNTEKYELEQFTKIKSTKEHVFLFTSPSTAVIIPVKAFKSEGDKNKLIDVVKGKKTLAEA